MPTPAFRPNWIGSWPPKWICVAAEVDHRVAIEVERRIATEVAAEVARQIQKFLEEIRLARHKMFGASSEAHLGQGLLFNEVEARKLALW